MTANGTWNGVVEGGVTADVPARVPSVLQMRAPPPGAATPTYATFPSTMNPFAPEEPMSDVSIKGNVPAAVPSVRHTALPPAGVIATKNATGPRWPTNDTPEPRPCLDAG
jgi:hypothetical protein